MARCFNCIHFDVCDTDKRRCEECWGDCSDFLNDNDVVPRSEVIDEFADRLKEKLFTIPTVYNAHFRKMIDAVMAEMKGGV